MVKQLPIYEITTKAGEKRWRVVYSYTDNLGKHRQEWRTATREAEAKRIWADLKAGQNPEGATIKLEAFLTRQWLPWIEANRRKLTHRKYEQLVRDHIIPALGHLKLKQVTRRTVGDFYDSLPPSIARTCHVALSSALTFAVRRKGLLAANPCGTVTPPTMSHKEARHVQPEEAKRMLEAARGNRLEGAIILGLVGGLRISEAVAVRWDDVDLNTGAVIVRGSYHGPTKSGKMRGLTLPPFATERLRLWKIRQAEHSLAGGIRPENVVTTWAGTPISLRYLAGEFRAFCERHRFDGMSFHSLRHGAAIAMLLAGVDPKTAAGRLGHSNPALLYSTYGHYVQAGDVQAAGKLEAFLTV